MPAATWQPGQALTIRTTLRLPGFQQAPVGHQSQWDSTWCELCSKHARQVPRTAGVVVPCRSGRHHAQSTSAPGAAQPAAGAVDALQRPACPGLPARTPATQPPAAVSIITDSAADAPRHSKERRLTMGTAPGSLVERCRDDSWVHACKRMLRDGSVPGKVWGSTWQATTCTCCCLRPCTATVKAMMMWHAAVQDPPPRSVRRAHASQHACSPCWCRTPGTCSPNRHDCMWLSFTLESCVGRHDKGLVCPDCCVPRRHALAEEAVGSVCLEVRPLQERAPTGPAWQSVPGRLARSDSACQQQ